jgi:hypothetical protein
MITLINGRGQIGEALKKIIPLEEVSPLEKIFIYHTWNISDKSEGIQRECYRNFVDFVNNHIDKKIIFISTYSQQDNAYNQYKHLSEAYLLSNNLYGRVIRLPTLIGKGVCEKFRVDEAEAFGEMELLSVQEAAEEVLKFATSSSHILNFRVFGRIVSANLVKELILFGKYGDQYSQFINNK